MRLNLQNIETILSLYYAYINNNIALTESQYMLLEEIRLDLIKRRDVAKDATYDKIQKLIYEIVRVKYAVKF